MDIKQLPDKVSQNPAMPDIVHSATDLLGIVTDALRIKPPLYLSSLLGLPWTRIPPYGKYSEFNIFSLWHPFRTLSYLIDVGVPSLPFKSPPFGPPLMDSFFFRPTLILRRPDHNGDYTSFPDEAWFFINGIMTNDALAQINAAYISDLFHRPVTIIQNTTNSMLIDLLECSLGKEWRHEWHDITEAAQKAFPPIYEALKNVHKNKVVVICHSQGTIIMSVVLTMLKALITVALGERLPIEMLEAPPPPGAAAAYELIPAAFIEAPVLVYPYAGIIDPNDFDPLSEQELAKLEIYCFANCANLMTYWKTAGQSGRPVPWIENFGNEFDIIARLGMFAPRAAHWGIAIDGPVYMQRGAWGHLLCEHYLKGIDNAQRVRLKKGGHGKNTTAPYSRIHPVPRDRPIAPRLFDYINGGEPPD